MMNSKFLLLTLGVFDHERVVQAEVVNVRPMASKLWPNTCAEVVLQRIEESGADLGERKFVAGDRVVWIVVEAPTCLGGSDESRAKLLGEATHGDEFIGHDLQRRGVINRVLVSENPFDVAEWSVVC